MDNSKSYPQVENSCIGRLPREQHAGRMRQTSTAGDDTPQTPQTSRPGTVIRAGSPTALLAVVPHLLGFEPDMSLVVIGTAQPRDRIRVTLRYDLPDPPDADLAADIAAHAAGVLGAQQLPAAVAVGYGPEALVTPVAGAFLDASHLAGIELHDVLRVENGRYWSYRCDDEACCPAAGVPFDGSAHPASAAMDGAGLRVLPGRAAVAARVAPLGGATAESMRRLPAGRNSTSPGCSPGSASPPASAPRGA